MSNPYRATLSSQLDRQPNPNFKTDSIVAVPGRDKIPLFERRSGVPYVYHLQSHRAPLIFVLPGLGGIATDGMAIALGDFFRRQGDSVIVLTSPFSWPFALSGSRSAMPGYLPRDAADLYEVMKKIIVKLKSENRLEVSNFGVIGYSLGGALVPFLLQEDRDQKRFRFARAVSVNPPVDLTRCMAKIDDYNNIGRDWSKDQKNLIMGVLMDAALKIIAGSDTGPAYYTHVNEIRMSDSQMKWVIGHEFRHSLSDLIFASQQVRDIGVLRTPANKYRRDARYAEASEFNFASYTHTFVAPSVRQEGMRGDDRTLLQKSDLRSLEELLIHEPGAYIIHNADDFIFDSDADLAFIRRAYGDRWTLFPHGGHVGNLWYPPFQKRLREIFADL